MHSTWGPPVATIIACMVWGGEGGGVKGGRRGKCIPGILLHMVWRDRRASLSPLTNNIMTFIC